jgi:signal transduction histidine kinase
MAQRPLDILVVDDDKGDRAFCQRALRSALSDGLRVLEADSGESGLKSIEAHAPDCVLLDHSLPGINGIEVLKRIRIKHPYLPVVMIDGKGNDVIAVQSMKEGAQDYIAKSTITPATLQRAVRMAIEHCILQQRDHEQRASLEIFTRALAHDLKEPVRTMRSFLDRIDDADALSASSQQSFQYIYKSARRMGALIDAVQVYTRLDAIERTERTPCDLADVLEQARENLAQLIDTRGAVITCDALPQVQSNAVQTLQLLQNLLANAIRHCESAAIVHVSAEEYGNQWLLTVRDNGSGVAPECLETIFEPFKRLSHRKDDESGMGLGLAISRKIVELHGGRIWCESRPGSGTSFLFTLPKTPVLTAPAGERQAQDAPVDEPAAIETKTLARILLVDDSEADIELNQIMLIEQAKLRCDLLTAADGKEALILLRNAAQGGRPIDLVLLDINMPVMNGFELLTQMRKEHMLADTLVVMCSTSNDDVDKEMAEMLGAAGYLTKPPNFSLLRDIINGCPRLRFYQDGKDCALLRAA